MVSDDDDDDDDEDDTEALLAELEQIKKERAEEKLRNVSSLLWRSPVIYCENIDCM